MKILVRRHLFLGLALTLAACSEDELPSGPGDGKPDATTSSTACNPPLVECPAGLVCVSGFCESPDGDGGPRNDGAAITRASIEVCTPEGCGDPAKVSFGGSRVGVTTSRTIRVKSNGQLPLEVRRIELVRTGTEFVVDPSGAVDVTLAPGEEMAVRINHTARDGSADDERLQIISNADRASVVVQLVTEYKGVPSLFVGTDPTQSSRQTQLLDFGNVRAGARESRVLYIKNRDVVIDGSVLDLSEVRTEPLSSTNFQIGLDARLPVSLNQFNSLCQRTAECSGAGDSCDTVLGVCRTGAGPLRDVVTATVTFIGGSAGMVTPGMIEERVVITSNDGGGTPVAREVVLRANVTFAALDVLPDPVRFDAYVGFTKTQTVAVQNAGTAELTVSRIQLRAPSAPFSIDTSGLAFPLRLAAGARATFSIAYTPPARAMHSATLEVTSDDPGMPVQTVMVIGDAEEPPVLVLAPAQVDFGDLHQRATADATVRVRNNGGSNLLIPSIAAAMGSPPEITSSASSLPPLPPGQETMFTLRFAPVAAMLYSGSFELRSNDPATPVARLPVRGQGINPEAFLFPPTPWDFNTNFTIMNRFAPSIFIGQRVTLSVRLSNGGAGPLAVRSIAINGDTRSAFRLPTPPAVPLVIQAGSSINFPIDYQAPAIGNDVAQLDIQTNDIDVGAGSGLLVAPLAGATSACTPRPNMTGTADLSGVCSYTCNNGFYDLNNDEVSDGCEYACTFRSMTDEPDDGFVDANCDGIDGRITDAIFVAPAPIGNDQVNQGTMASPYATIQNAMAVAGTRNKNQIYVSQGDYSGPLTLVDGISIYGGYDALNRWSRGSDRTTSIRSSSARGVIAQNIRSARTVFDRFQVIAGNGTSPGESSIGLYIADSTSVLEVRNSVVIAGQGAPGGDGGHGGQGGGGSTGSTGGDGCQGCSGAGGGANGGASSCGRTGGRGGDGGNDNATGGHGARPGGGTCVRGTSDQGCGGRGAQVCATSACSSCGGRKGGEAGADGLTGATGGIGTRGTAGSGSGSVQNGVFAGGRGGNGGAGEDGVGGGGGGGGGGGADECYQEIVVCFEVPFATCDTDGGGGGGGGGGAGCGGTGGDGGFGGGGSFAIFAHNSSAVIFNCDLRAGTGGRGGRGGDGGPGGTGGGGGPIGSGVEDSGDGGRGGRGGDGGQGGGGGGGAGGPAYALARSASPSLALTGNVYAPGAGGPGGLGGMPNGRQGQQGTTGTTISY